MSNKSLSFHRTLTSKEFVFTRCSHEPPLCKHDSSVVFLHSQVCHILIYPASCCCNKGSSQWLQKLYTIFVNINNQETLKATINVPFNVRVTQMPIKGEFCLESKPFHLIGFFASVVISLDAEVQNCVHLIIVDSEVGLLSSEVPLYDCPTLKTYKQL